MPVPAAPVITSVTIEPDQIASGVTVAARVTWTGYPVRGVTYQWRDGLSLIRGATVPTYTPAVAIPDLNCLVHIDNGHGTATSASAPAEQESEIPDNAMTAGGDALTAGGDYLTAGE